MPKELPSCGTKPLLPWIALEQAPVYPCPSLAEVEMIRREIPISIKAGPTAGTVGCRAADGSADLTNEEAQIYSELLFMRRLSFSEPLPWTAKPLYDWFREAIRGISLEVGSGNSYCYPQEKIIHIVYTQRTPLRP